MHECILYVLLYVSAHIIYTMVDSRHACLHRPKLQMHPMRDHVGPKWEKCATGGLSESDAKNMVKPRDGVNDGPSRVRRGGDF